MKSVRADDAANSSLESTHLSETRISSSLSMRRDHCDGSLMCVLTKHHEDEAFMAEGTSERTPSTMKHQGSFALSSDAQGWDIAAEDQYLYFPSQAPQLTKFESTVDSRETILIKVIPGPAAHKSYLRRKSLNVRIRCKNSFQPLVCGRDW